MTSPSTDVLAGQGWMPYALFPLHHHSNSSKRKICEEESYSSSISSVCKLSKTVKEWKEALHEKWE